MFNAQPQQPANNMFATANTFGNTPNTGMPGSTMQPQGGMFNQPATASTNNMFNTGGNQQPQANSMFGANTPSTNQFTFGNNTNTNQNSSFNNQQPGMQQPGMLGSNTNQSNMFNTNPGTNNMFNSGGNQTGIMNNNPMGGNTMTNNP